MVKLRRSPAERAAREAEKQEGEINRLVNRKAGEAKEGIVNARSANGGPKEMHPSYIGEAPDGLSDKEFLHRVGSAAMELLRRSGYRDLAFDPDYSEEVSRRTQEEAARGDPHVPDWITPKGLYAIFKHTQATEGLPTQTPVALEQPQATQPEEKTYGDGWLPPVPPAA